MEDPNRPSSLQRKAPKENDVGITNEDILARALATLLQDTPGANPYENVLSIHGNQIIEMLAALQYEKTEGLPRYEAAKARKANTSLNQDRTESTKVFQNLLKEAKVSQERVESFSEFTYGMQKLEETYYQQMLGRLKEEQQANFEYTDHTDLFASEYISPQNDKARKRFLTDIRQIFTFRLETANTESRSTARSRFNDFHSFMKVYLGLVRDTLGSLFAREHSLDYTSISSPEEELTKEDMKSRRAVISLHYLGLTERLFQVIEELQPLADIAFNVGHKFLNRAFIEEKLQIARKTLDELFLKEHGLQRRDVNLTQDPQELPSKPLSKNQKKKLKKREAAKRGALGASEQKREEEEKILQKETSQVVSSAVKKSRKPLC